MQGCFRKRNSPCTSLESPLVRPGFAGSDVPAERGQPQWLANAWRRNEALWLPTKHVWRPDEAISSRDEAGLKPDSAIIRSCQKRGAIMWDIIISLFYHRSCRSSLVEMRTHHLAR
jgi:hypothetical protein